LSALTQDSVELEEERGQCKREGRREEREQERGADACVHPDVECILVATKLRFGGSS
jgi:hypothetical protein